MNIIIYLISVVIALPLLLFMMIVVEGYDTTLKDILLVLFYSLTPFLNIVVIVLVIFVVLIDFSDISNLLNTPLFKPKSKE